MYVLKFRTKYLGYIENLMPVIFGREIVRCFHLYIAPCNIRPHDGLLFALGRPRSSSSKAIQPRLSQQLDTPKVKQPCNIEVSGNTELHVH